MPRIKLELNKDDFKKKLDIKDGKTPTKKELVSIIKPLIPEPKKEVIIEKTEVIKEQPIIKEVAVTDSAEVIAEKINTLDGEIDFKVLKNVPKGKSAVINRMFGGASSDSMLKSTYDPAGGAKQVAFEDEINSFETVSKNLRVYPYALTYTGDTLSYITYTVPTGTIVKTFNWTGSQLDSIVLSGATPSGISLTKTLTWSGSTLSSVAYS